MSQHRRIARVVTAPPLAPGFVGPGHLAAQVVSPEDFGRNDPFIMLADDHLDIGDQRWTTPGFQDIHTGMVPVRREPGVEIRIYSGGSGKLQSATRNHVPVTIVEIAMDAHAAVDQEIPIAYNGFLYVISGSVRVGEDAALLQTGQVGWLDRPEGEGTSVVRVAAEEEGARLVVYAGQPQGNAIVSHGPFIGDSRDDIVGLYMEYRAGRFERMSNLARKNRIA